MTHRRSPSNGSTDEEAIYKHDLISPEVSHTPATPAEDLLRLVDRGGLRGLADAVQEIGFYSLGVFLPSPEEEFETGPTSVSLGATASS